MQLKVQITYFLGLTSMKTNDLHAAAKYFEQSLTLKPANKAATKKLKQVRAKLKQLSQLTPATLMHSTNVIPPIPPTKDSASCNSPPSSASQQCDVVRKLMEQEKQNPNEVRTHVAKFTAHPPFIFNPRQLLQQQEENTYIINIDWWNSWCKYTGFAEDASDSSSTAAAPRPSAINNESVQLALQQKGEPCLEAADQPAAPWKVLPAQVWVALHSWYGGGPAIQISGPDHKISYVANNENSSVATTTTLPRKRPRRPVGLCYVCFKRCRPKTCSRCKAVAYCGNKCQVSRFINKCTKSNF